MIRWVLHLVAGEGESEYVLGDLDEEYLDVRRERGRRAAARWHAWQVLRSIVPLLAMRVRSGELTHALVAGLLGAAAPLWLCDRFWSLLYSQIPLKDGIGRTPAQFALTLLLLCVCAAAAGSTASSRERAIAVSVSAAFMTAAAIAAATGATPFAFIASALVLAPLSVAGAHWRVSKCSG
jgi:hypothetical protein